MKNPLWILAFMIPLWAQDDVCLECHEVSTSSSIHQEVDCETCHSQLDLDQHFEEGVVPIFSQEEACGSCHEDAWTEHTASVHGLKLGQLAQEEATCVDCHGTHDIVPSTDINSMVHPGNLLTTCGQCHSRPNIAEKFGIPVKNPYELYSKSVHAHQIEKGNLEAATCSDCHGVHNIRNLTDTEATIYGANLPATCGKCHPEEMTDYQESIHWEAYQKGIRRTPLCNDCHLEHAILPPQEPGSPTSTSGVPATCGSCHADEQVIRRYGLASYRLESFYASYHGLALAGGGDRAASCVSCHGYHSIWASADTRSKVHTDNIAATCGTCHPGIGTEITVGSIHSEQPGTGGRVIAIVRSVYIWIIILAVIGMLLHNFLDMRRKIISPPITQAASGASVVRFNRIERSLHWSVLGSFMILAWSGFGLAYPESIWALLWNEQARGWVHRIASVILLTGLGVSFLLQIITHRGRQQAKALWPRGRDLSDARQFISYNSGFSQQKPRFARYSYIEKFEYWALIWGIVIMGVTGLGLWFENTMLRMLPKWWLDLFTLIHFYEALLACLAILIWHFYWVIFDPEVYPGSGAFWHGKINEERYAEEHPLDMDRARESGDLQ